MPTSSVTDRRTRLQAQLSNVAISMATVDDVPALVQRFSEYMDMTDWKDFMEFDRERCAKYLTLVIENCLTPHILAKEKDTGAIVGLLSYETPHDFFTKPIALSNNLWVHPDYQQSRLGRLLVATMIELAVTCDGASVVHFPVLSHLPAARSLKNLLKKAGFHELGYVMRRGLP